MVPCTLIMFQSLLWLFLYLSDIIPYLCLPHLSHCSHSSLLQIKTKQNKTKTKKPHVSPTPTLAASECHLRESQFSAEVWPSFIKWLYTLVIQAELIGLSWLFFKKRMKKKNKIWSLENDVVSGRGRSSKS